MSKSTPAPAATTAAVRAELTMRGVILGVVITVLFTAANVYFGLKAGLTFATSIPAAVISMAVLRGFAGHDHPGKQHRADVASAAGTLSAIIFVLPGLVMIGWWTGFPYWDSFAICALGGMLGVMYSIPLRRALVTQSDLPYPEGVACAEVLKVGGGEHADAAAVEDSRAGLRGGGLGLDRVGGVCLSSWPRACSRATWCAYFRVGDSGGVTGFDFILSFALFAVGHLVGLWVGIAMLVGALIGWVWGVPHYSALARRQRLDRRTWRRRPGATRCASSAPAPSAWRRCGRWPSWSSRWSAGSRSAMAASRARAAGSGALLPRTEQDIPIGWVGVDVAACAWCRSAGCWRTSATVSGLGDHMLLLVIGGADLHRADELLRLRGLRLHGRPDRLLEQPAVRHRHTGGDRRGAAAGVRRASARRRPSGQQALVAFALFVTAVVFAVATIANNNLQDLKTGQLVDATPWKQQVALVIGVHRRRRDHSADPRPAQPRLRLRRRARPACTSIRCPRRRPA